LDPESNDLVALLVSIRYRLGERFEMAGLELLWEVDEIPMLVWLQASDALSVLRLIQEALINALKHAKGSQVKVAPYPIKTMLLLPLPTTAAASKAKPSKLAVA
jgi:signal transduction histidine kinase